jgi:outer membrane receptor protein involved in Fe transport
MPSRRRSVVGLVSARRRGRAPRRAALRCLPALAVLLALWGPGGAAPVAAQAPTGRLAGRVVQEATGEPVSLAEVVLVGTGRSALTDLDGGYVVEGITAGVYDVLVRRIGYGRKLVTGVRVEAGTVTVLDVALATAAVQLEELVVTAESERGAAAALLADRRRAAAVEDGIAAEQIARTPDSDAAAVLRRVPGVSVVGGRYVNVRGLGDRYGAALLNGAPLPSAESDRKVIPLDLIPAAFLERVTTVKTYTPDRPGDYAGGLVELETEDVPPTGHVDVRASLGFDTRASFRQGLGYAGGRYDWLGLGNGGRSLPDIVPRDRPVVPGVTVAPDEAERIGEAFSRPWGPSAERLPPNSGLGLSFATRGRVGATAIGVVGAVRHAVRWEHREGLVERVFASAGAAEPEVDYRGAASTEQANVGALLRGHWVLGPLHALSLSGLYNRVTEDEARILEGFNLDSNTDQRNTRIRYVAHSVAALQLAGRHAVPGWAASTWEWRASYVRTTRDEPNTREVLYRRAPDGRFLFDTFVQSGSVFHQALTDDGWAAGWRWRAPIVEGRSSAAAVIGADVDVRDRQVYARRFRFVPAGPLADSVRALPPDALFAPEHISPDSLVVREATFPGDNYDARGERIAAFAMLDATWAGRMRAAGGVRVERGRQRVFPRDRLGLGIGLPGARLDDVDVLPSANLRYALTDAMNLRLGFSRTVARPEMRELAPFGYADYAGAHLVAGNPTLRRSRIENWDLRWEWFPERGSVLAASVFYKEFRDPIEQLVFPSSELIKSWVNARGAENYGLELELRVSLGGLLGAVGRHLDVGGNLTLVRSTVALGDTVSIYVPGTGPTLLAVTGRERPLQGQSPYVVNLGLTGRLPGSGAEVSLLYHRFGRRVDAAGSQALPEVYEEARGELDLVVEQPVGPMRVKLSTSRLLGEEARFTQGGEVLRRHPLGRTVSITLGWSPSRR